MGDFNSRSKSWGNEDIIRNEGLQIEFLTTTYGLHQLISNSSHTPPNFASCIDLIFTDQPNLVINSGVHPSLRPNCHQQIIYCKFNLFVEYPYEWLVWDYGKANCESIKRVLEQGYWQHIFQNKDINQQASILTNTLIFFQSLYQIKSLLLLIETHLG